MKIKKPKMVCVFAHPDDESFGPGGAIAKFAKTYDVIIVCVTSGDADPQFTNHDHTKLGDIRELELLEAGKILGVKKVEFLRFKDGSLCNNKYHRLAEKIKKKLDKYKPEKVMTFDFAGVSGHLDHVAVTMATSFVVKKSDYVIETLYYCESKDITDAFGKDYFIYVPHGYTKEQVDLVIDYSEEVQQMEQAMMAHKSQVSDGKWFLDLKAKFPREQYFFVIKKPLAPTT